ncbi:MAG: hypothetical protein RJA81_391, partial [Planctomycetota bacterium]
SKIAQLTQAIWGHSLKLQFEISDKAVSSGRQDTDHDARWEAIEKESILNSFFELFQPRRFWIDQDGTP